MKARWVAASWSVLALSVALYAQPAAADETPQVKEMRAALADAQTVAKTGPTTVAVSDIGTIDVPAGYVFIPEPQADRLMQAMGNSGKSERVGLIYDRKSGTNNFADVSIQRSGHVPDDDSSKLDAEKILGEIRANTDASNRERAQRGIPVLHVDGWAQAPAYDPALHRLAWAVDAHEDTQHGNHLLNYRTLMLGRDSTIAITTVANSASAAAGQKMASELIGATEFLQGKKYADFNRATDKVAEYGLVALIVGVAAKKLGLIALAGVFAVKFAKLIAVGFVALTGGLARFFRRGPKSPAA